MEKDLKNKEIVSKPWGSFTRFTLNETSTVKIVDIKKDQSTSLQSHKNRSEFLKILKGDARITIGQTVQRAKAGEEFFIGPNSVHRLEAGAEDAEILEISFGNFDEEDIIRLEDKYGRALPSNDKK